MKRKLISLLMACCLVFALAACGGPGGAPLTEYTAPSGTFAVSVPEIKGGWTESNGGNDYHLALDNSDKSFTLMIQAIPLEQSQQAYSDLDALIEFYQQNTLSSFGEPTTTEVTIGDPAIAGVKSESYKAEKGGMTAKALVSFFQTEKAYYVCILTGSADAYDANIDAVKNALTSFTEKG